MTPEKLVEELDRAVQVPGLTNIWVPPIRNRIDMLATGIKSPLGIKVAGATSPTSTRVAHADRARREARARRHLGARRAAHAAGAISTSTSTAPRPRATASTSPTCSRWCRAAIGGENIGETIEGLRALPDQRALSARAARFGREAAAAADRHRARRADHARRRWRAIGISDGPPMLKSENARLSGWVYVDIRGRDLASVVRRRCSARSRGRCKLPPGIRVAWSGQFEYLERANARLAVVVPFDAGYHLRAAVPHLPALRRGAAHHGAPCRSR